MEIVRAPTVTSRVRDRVVLRRGDGHPQGVRAPTVTSQVPTRRPLPPR
ncbi:unannotated protein [freshwater metagenome]|uniref:Unannotated protein n=1 Tax=freshwater metagenome TaxID=449393 RepID=A0A6J7HMU1_9ZZZZ